MSSAAVPILMTVALVGAATPEAPSSRLIFDFGDERVVGEWMTVNDTVMGGRSSSRLESTADDTVVFTGNVSLENNGGFASIRSRPRERDLSDFAGLVLRVRGDGGRYKINLKHDAYLDGVLYRAAFDTVQGEWQTVRVRFEDFESTFRGRRVRGAKPLDLAHVTSFGLMISDKQAGPFRLELSRIEAFQD